MFLKWVKYRNGRNFFWFSTESKLKSCKNGFLSMDSRNKVVVCDFDAREIKAAYSFRVITTKILKPRFEKEFFHPIKDSPTPIQMINDLQADAFIDKLVNNGVIRLETDVLDFYLFLMTIATRDHSGKEIPQIREPVVRLAASFIKEGLGCKDICKEICIKMLEKYKIKKMSEKFFFTHDFYPILAFYIKQWEDYFDKGK